MIVGMHSGGLMGKVVSLLAVAFLVVATSPRTLAAHKFHASLTQIEVNASAGTIEVGIRLFVDDLEDALTRRAGRRVRLGTTAGIDAMALAYLRSSLEVEDANGQKLKLEWVGKEASVDIVWLYVEAPLRGRIEGGRIGNALFFELFEDQVNTVNLKDGHRTATLTFATGDAAKRIELPAG